MTAWLALLALLAGWLYMNHYYRRIYGHRLRWWAFWAAHGALLFGFRLPRWEKS